MSARRRSTPTTRGERACTVEPATRRAGAIVTGTWSVGGTSTCTTGTNGRCQVSKAKLPGTTISVMFTVTSVAWSGGTYVSAENHDSDLDSTGTLISIAKP